MAEVNSKTKTASQLAIEAQNARNIAAKQSSSNMQTGVATTSANGARLVPTGPAPTIPSLPTFQMPQIQAPQVQSQNQTKQMDFGSGGGGAATPQLQLNAQPGKDSVAFLDQIKGRLADQQSHENDSLKSSADRAINLSTRDITDAAAAKKKMKQEELAARGLSSSSGAGAGQLRAISEGSQTRQAKASSDIAVQRERDQDALNIQRQGMVNSLYGQAGQAAQTPFNQQMQGNQLNLNAWNSLAGNELGKAGLAQSGNIAQANLGMQANQMNNQNQMAMWQALMNLQR